MRNYLLALFAFLFLLSISNKTQACVDYHPDSVRVIIVMDTLCNLEIRVTNLQLFGGDANHFCSCGVANAIPNGITLDYVAFVDSITGIPVEGFDPWQFLPEAGNSWENVDPQSLDWSGFVSDVNESGLQFGSPVDLVIRGHVSTGWYCQAAGENIEALMTLAFGSDEWDDDNTTLAGSHQDITYFADVPWGLWEFIDETPSYFEQLDSVILGVEINERETFNLYPNPANDMITIDCPSVPNEILVLDNQGKVIQRILPYSSKVQMELGEMPAGSYFISVRLDSGVLTERLTIQ